jgi:hypothetical protein
MIISDLQKVLYTIDPASILDKIGNPATIDIGSGGPKWSTSDPTAIILEPAADGMSCMMKSADEAGHLGDFQVAASIDKNMAPDIEENIVITDTLTVVGSQAFSATMTAGVPEDK